MKSRILVLKEKGKLEIDEIEISEALNDDEILIKQLGSNICTTDYTQWLGQREHQGYPMAGGHEGSGIVEKLPDNYNGELKVGDHVAVAYSYCGQCKDCRQGNSITCGYRDALLGYPVKWHTGYYGTHGFSEYFVRKSNTLIKMNPKVSSEEAGFLEPLATVVNGIRKLRLKPLENVVVIGAGTMGLLNALTARAFGGNVAILEINDKKKAKAKSYGFDVFNSFDADYQDQLNKKFMDEPIDCVILGVGSSKANEQALEIVRLLDGRVLFFSAHFPKPELNVDSNDIHYKKLELLGAFEANQTDFYDAAKMINNGIIDVSKLVESKFEFENFNDAYASAATEGSYRVHLKVCD